MAKKLIVCFCFWCFGLYIYAQVNMTQLGYLDIPTLHDTGLNGIWGYTDETGKEYALVGTEDGVSIVDISLPSSPIEIVFIPGENSIWREIKTNGDYAYVTTEADEGLLIIDLSPLPSSTVLPTNYYVGPAGNEWNTAHSLYADNGYVYINGSGRGNGGLIILDVTTDPMNPIELGEFDMWYVHDCYVRDDTAYLAHIYDGFFSILDITDKSNPVFLGSAITPTNFSHNIWTSDDGNFAFTTDEVSGGFIGAFDVSNPAAIQYLDKIQSSPGNGIVPHNAHVIGDYLVTSYYADGVVIHDITYPYNLIQVGNHDTNPHELMNTSGCWGVYPYFPSGNIIASDREEGLFIFAPNYQPGAYLEGNITELGTGNPINNVSVSVENENISDLSGIFGDYATGIATAGTYDVTYFKVLYYPQTISTSFTNGVVELQDVVLEKIPQFSQTIQVLDAGTLNPIVGCQVKLQHTYISHEGITNASGQVSLGLYYQDNYDLVAGKWGYVSNCFIDTLITSSTGIITILIDEGYYDDFSFDYGWLSAGDAAKGFWEREIPVGVAGNSGIVQNPYSDVGWDCGDFAYLTGNGSASSNTDEVNGGEVVLISPVFDLSSYTDPHLNFTSWFYNQYGLLTVNDTLNIYLFDGVDMVLISQKYAGNSLMSQWVPNSIRVLDFMPLSSAVQIILTIRDDYASENITEAGLDNFSITNFSLAAISDEELNDDITIYPNPTTGEFTVNGLTAGKLVLCDVSGRVIAEQSIADVQGLYNFSPGIYFVVIYDQHNQYITTKKIYIE
ncbi:MAG: choice-of-anchor B family protein [Crocinitomicaceae bacterium]|nr:choice-of-anchor B family protein [Crocinitomicaceae bacterium]